VLLNTGPDDQPSRRSSGPPRAWRALRGRRRGRPFRAGLLVALSGLVVLAPPYANLRLGDLDIIGIKVPVDHTAANPPPLNVPFATFTDVTVQNTDLRGGVLKIPGAHISVR
jgi:hypothetical protein